MLNMDYFDRNGNKWSIENGDWLGHQSENNPVGNNKRLIGNNLGLIILILVAVITCFLTLV